MIKLFLKNICYIIFMFVFICCSDKKNTEEVIDSNAKDGRITQHLVDSIINRRYLSINSFRNTDYDFQYLNEDEWGISFVLIRIDLGKRIILIEQDSFTRLHKVFEYEFKDNDEKRISDYIEPIIQGEIKYPDPSRNLIDGGNVSILYRHNDTVSVRYWQENQRLPRNDLERIDQIIDSLRNYIEERKFFWQE